MSDTIFLIQDGGELVELARSRLTRSWELEECQQYLHTQECPNFLK